MWFVRCVRACVCCVQDPFTEPSPEANREKAERFFKAFIPLDYDVYVFGVQEGVSDSVFDAFAQYTGWCRKGGGGATCVRAENMLRKIRGST